MFEILIAICLIGALFILDHIIKQLELIDDIDSTIKKMDKDIRRGDDE